AVLTGLGGAWLARGYLVAEGAAPAPAPPAAGFLLQGSAETYPTLAAALAGAADGDTVLVRGDGPYATGPLRVTGKALTLRAAPGAHPVLHLDAPAQPWQALLTTDRPLALEGIELRRAQGGEPGHLLYATGASLRMDRCRVTAPHHSA